jgi:hypothetical protein
MEWKMHDETKESNGPILTCDHDVIGFLGDGETSPNEGVNVRRHTIKEKKTRRGFSYNWIQL